MMLESCYGECLVHRKTPLSTSIIKFLIIAMMIVSGLATMIFFMMAEGILTMILAVFVVVGIMLVIYVFPRFNIDWEYIFVDGQLDFDQILGGNARKHKDRIDFEKTEVVAPTGSYHLDNYKNVDIKTLDYSSLEGDNTYTVICRKDEQMVRILFSPDEKFVTLMKQKSPRKVFTD